MSASNNPDAMYNQGEFSSRVPPSEPLTTKGHAPGVKVGNDKYPEFNLETHPAGTAPQENTFQPQPTEEIPGQAQNKDVTVGTSASETLVGSTSADVHQGLGQPASGMTSQELHGGKNKKERSGLTGVAANLDDPQHQKLADRDHSTGHRGVSNNPSEHPSAQDVEPATADEVAAERPGGLK